MTMYFQTLVIAFDIAARLRSLGYTDVRVTPFNRGTKVSCAA